MRKIIFGAVLLFSMMSCTKEMKKESAIKEYVLLQHPNINGYELKSIDNFEEVTIGTRILRNYIACQERKESYIRAQKQMDEGHYTGSYQSNLAYEGANGGIAKYEELMKKLEPFVKSTEISYYQVSFSYKKIDNAGNGKILYDGCMLDSDYKPTNMDEVKEKLSKLIGGDVPL